MTNVPKAEVNVAMLQGDGSTSSLTLEKVAALAAKVQKEWLSGLTDAEAVEKHVTALLNRQLEALVAGTLGFDEHWGRWEIHTTNGREPAIAKAIKTETEVVARKMVVDALANFTSKIDWVKLIRREYEQAIKVTISHAVEEVAAQEAERLVTSVLQMPIDKLRDAFIAESDEDD